MRSGRDTDGRHPDDVSNNPVFQLGPFLLSLNEEFLELDDHDLCLGQLALTFLQLTCCLLHIRATTLNPHHQRRHLPLQDQNRVVKGTNITLDGYKEVGESFGAHEDNLLLRPHYLGVVRIVLICSGKRTYQCRCRDHCLRHRGKGCASSHNCYIYT